MMSDDSDQAIPKIVDFGFSRFLSPQGTAAEPFGTLGYAAPEILSQTPYSYKCDLWSVGCILFVLMCGKLPFDHAD